MLSFLKIQKKGVLGLDLSGSHLRMLELSGTADEPVVEHYAIVDIPDDIYSHNEVHDPDKLGQLIQNAYRRNGFSFSHVALALPATLVHSKECDIVEGLRSSDQLEEVQKEAANLVSVDIEELYIDYKVLGPSKMEGMERVAFAVCKKENVEARVAALEVAGLQAKAADADANAMAQAVDSILQYQHPNLLKENVMIVELGSDVTSYLVYNNQKLIWSQEHHLGTSTLLDSIRQTYGGDTQSALKMLSDIEDTLKEHGRFEADVLQPFSDSLSMEVTRHIELFGETGLGFGIASVFVSGVVASVPDLDVVVSDRTGVQTYVANPLAHCTLAKNINSNKLLDDAPQLMVTVGMALRNFE